MTPPPKAVAKANTITPKTSRPLAEHEGEAAGEKSRRRITAVAQRRRRRRTGLVRRIPTPRADRAGRHRPRAFRGRGRREGARLRHQPLHRRASRYDHQRQRRHHPRRRITLVAAGAGAGIAATFNAPIGGVMFAIELMMPEVSVRTFLPVAIATGTATFLGRYFLGYSARVPGAAAAPLGTDFDSALLLCGEWCGCPWPRSLRCRAREDRCSSATARSSPRGSSRGRRSSGCGGLPATCWSP